MEVFTSNRDFMKSGFDTPGREFISDQERGLTPPPVEKDTDSSLKIIDLPPADPDLISQPHIFDCLNNRRSRRSCQNVPLTLAELSFLLWASQGVQRIIPAYKKTGHITLRPVPSAGGRHAFETYLAINQVEGLERGIYRYLPVEHKLVFLHREENLAAKLIYAYGGEDYQDEAQWLGKVPVVFLWSCLPARGEWRYHMEAHRLMLIDIGHVCQNLYLASEALKCGTCAIAAFVQKEMDALFKLDGEDEFVVYIAAVGKQK